MTPPTNPPEALISEEARNVGIAEINNYNARKCGLIVQQYGDARVATETAQLTEEVRRLREALDRATAMRQAGDALAFHADHLGEMASDLNWDAVDETEDALKAYNLASNNFSAALNPNKTTNEQ